MSALDKLFGPIAVNDNSPKCARCEAPFEPRHGKRFCSDACQRADHNDRRRGDKDARLAGAPEHVCEHCGETFRRRKDRNNTARFCSRDCSNASGANISETQRLRSLASSLSVSFTIRRCLCIECGNRFNGRTLGDRCCSDQCLSAYSRKKYIAYNDNGRDRSPRPCATCGGVFEPEYGDRRRKFCSKECNAKSAEAKAIRKAAKMRRKCAVVEAVDPIEVFNRDGWRCQLCGVKTPKKLRGTYEDLAPELDHIIPISVGGEHSYRNTQCACRRCNASKSAIPLGQLRLFG